MRRINVIAAVPFALLTLAAPHNVLLRARGQVTKPAGDPGVQLLANGVGRMEGVDGSSGIAYTRLFLSSAPSAGKVMDLKTPTLTLQCTKQPGGKLGIELFVNFGGIDDPAFYPPWRASGPAEVFRPVRKRCCSQWNSSGTQR